MIEFEFKRYIKKFDQIRYVGRFGINEFLTIGFYQESDEGDPLKGYLKFKYYNFVKNRIL
jgi:hypothetical protein